MWERSAYLQYNGDKCVTKYVVRYDNGKEKEYTDNGLITNNIVFLRQVPAKKVTDPSKKVTPGLSCGAVQEIHRIASRGGAASAGHTK